MTDKPTEDPATVTVERAGQLQHQNGLLSAQLARYHAALSFYGNEANWPNKVRDDKGETARRTLWTPIGQTGKKDVTNLKVSMDAAIPEVPRKGCTGCTGKP
jgi:RecA/RadA recombinase